MPLSPISGISYKKYGIEEKTLNFEKVLVTGGAGFIGSHIVDELLADGLEVSVLDDLSSGKMKNMEKHLNGKNFQFMKGDIRDERTAKQAVNDVDAVFHEAALVSVTRSVENPLLTNEVNVAGTLNLLKASSDASVKRFIYASSSSVYGETETLPKKETVPTRPISPYAASKLAAENYCKAFYKVYGLETVSIRYFNVYGPRQTYGPYSGVITIFINRLLNDEPPIIYGDGMQTRDFTDVQDAVQASLLSLNCKNAVGEEFNVATGQQTTINQLAQTLLNLAGKTSLQPIHAEPRPGDIKHSYADISKAKKILGYEPKITLKEGLNKLIEWYKKSPREGGKNEYDQLV